jgi:hypothetical protein
MAGGQLGIVEKTGKNDLQTEADRFGQLFKHRNYK